MKITTQIKGSPVEASGAPPSRGYEDRSRLERASPPDRQDTRSKWDRISPTSDRKGERSKWDRLSSSPDRKGERSKWDRLSSPPDRKEVRSRRDWQSPPDRREERSRSRSRPRWVNGPFLPS